MVLKNRRNFLVLLPKKQEDLVLDRASSSRSYDFIKDPGPSLSSVLSSSSSLVVSLSPPLTSLNVIIKWPKSFSSCNKYIVQRKGTYLFCYLLLKSWDYLSLLGPNCILCSTLNQSLCPGNWDAVIGLSQMQPIAIVYIVNSTQTIKLRRGKGHSSKTLLLGERDKDVWVVTHKNVQYSSKRDD